MYHFNDAASGSLCEDASLSSISSRSRAQAAGEMMINLCVCHQSPPPCHSLQACDLSTAH